MGKYLIISIVGLYGLFAIITKLCQLYKNMEEKFPNEKEDFYKEFGNLSKKERKEIIDLKEEIADVLFFVLRFAQMNDLDLDDCITEKLQKNSQKYTVEKCKGKNLKYTEI